MIRKLLIASMVVALAGLGFAQTTIIVPSTSTDNDQIAMGEFDASVDQTVKLILPRATALHLTASTLTFDMSQLANNWYNRAIGATDDDGPKCVYAVGPDETLSLDSTYWGQVQTVPGGVPYEAEFAPYPNITVDGKPVVNYPPLQLEDGKLVAGSKNHFVCYQSFIIQLFSNSAHWDLQVARDDKGGQGIEHLYVQGNTCSDFGTPTGLYALNNGDKVHLIPTTMTEGPTGKQVTATCNKDKNTSWLDVLGVIGVKVNSDVQGTSTANLTYTLISKDVPF